MCPEDCVGSGLATALAAKPRKNIRVQPHRHATLAFGHDDTGRFPELIVRGLDFRIDGNRGAAPLSVMPLGHPAQRALAATRGDGAQMMSPMHGICFGSANIPSVLPVFLRASSVRIKKSNVSQDPHVVSRPRRTARRCLSTYGPCVSNSFFDSHGGSAEDHGEHGAVHASGGVIDRIQRRTGDRGASSNQPRIAESFDEQCLRAALRRDAISNADPTRSENALEIHPKAFAP